jgi:hypothetical protein
MEDKQPKLDQLWKEIDEILWNEWDCLGLTYNEDQRGQYYGYIISIYHLLVSRGGKKKITQFLCKIEKELTGKTPNKKNCEKVAERLMNITLP